MLACWIWIRVEAQGLGKKITLVKVDYTLIFYREHRPRKMDVAWTEQIWC